jgi:hypothetical protein
MQNPFAVLTNPVVSDLVQLTPIFEQFVKKILALVAILVIAAAVSARRSPSLSLPARTRFRFGFGFGRGLAEQDGRFQFSQGQEQNLR